MGQARLKLLESGKVVNFDFSAPELYLPANLPITKDKAVKALIAQAVQHAFPQGVDRTDGKVWAAWQEILDEESPVYEMPYSQVIWLKKVVSNESLKLPVQLAQWREALVDYLDALKPVE